MLQLVRRLSLALLSVLCAVTAVVAQTEPQAQTQTQTQAQALSPEQQALLAQLKDLHSPPAPSWWPPAPGWWLLAALLILAMGIIVWQLRKKRTADTVIDWRTAALNEADQLDELLQAGAPSNQVVAQASVLMRRVALARMPRSEVANVSQQQWLQVLDELGETDQYSAGAGQLLVSHPYRKGSDIDRTELTGLLTLIRRTIHCKDTRRA